MTPKEKAIELVDKMHIKTDVIFVMSKVQAKKCALIALEFSLEFITGDLNESFDKTMYLFEVKQEIEKL